MFTNNINKIKEQINKYFNDTDHSPWLGLFSFGTIFLLPGGLTSRFTYC